MEARRSVQERRPRGQTAPGACSHARGSALPTVDSLWREWNDPFVSAGPYREPAPVAPSDPYVQALSRLRSLRGTWEERRPEPSSLPARGEPPGAPRWTKNAPIVLSFVFALSVSYLAAVLTAR